MYAQLQRFAENDNVAFKLFVEQQDGWEVLVDGRPMNANSWVSLNMVTPVGRIPLWIRYTGDGEESLATEKLVEDYKKERERLNLGSIRNPVADKANTVSKVGIYILINTILPAIATQSRWYMFLLFFIAMILLWLYSGRSNKSATAILWIMRIITIASIAVIIIRMIG